MRRHITTVLLLVVTAGQVSLHAADRIAASQKRTKSSSSQLSETSQPATKVQINLGTQVIDAFSNGIHEDTPPPPQNVEDEPVLPPWESDTDRESLQVMLAEDFNGDGLTALLIDGTDYSDKVELEIIGGAVLVTARTTVSGVVVDELIVTFDRLLLSKIVVRTYDDVDTINNYTDIDFKASLGDGVENFCFVGYGPAYVDGGAGIDSINGLQCQSLNASGGDGTDYLYGSEFTDWLIGGDGDDVIFGRNGGDLIEGGAGVDYLFGEEGNDRIAGGKDQDIISGGPSDDTLSGMYVYDPFKSLDDFAIDILIGDSGADTFFVHRYVVGGYALDYPDDLNEEEGDQVDTDWHLHPYSPI